MVVHPDAFGSVSGGTVTKRSLPPFRGAVSVFRGADHVGYFMGRSGLTQQCAAAKPGVHQSRKLENECVNTKAAAHRTQDNARTVRVRVSPHQMIQIGFRRLLVEVDVVILALDVVFQ